MEEKPEFKESESEKPTNRKSPLSFNVLLALALIGFAIAFVLVWAFVVTPVCNESEWKPPCPPKGFVG